MSEQLHAVNWDRLNDEISLTFWNQQISQFWLEHDVPMSEDRDSWVHLTDDEKDAFKKVLGGLTLLDTEQGGEGMPLIAVHTENLQQKAVLTLFGAMEQIHAKSYSYIFTTLASREEIDEIFDWVRNHPQLQYKAKRIASFYRALLKPEVTKKELYMSMVASVLLESFLFYSGFFYPLYLRGQGRMTSSGEIIRLILRDESIHGLYVGRLAQDIFNHFSEEEQKEIEKQVYDLLMDLYQNEMKYTEEIYKNIGLVDEVKTYVRYNANRAMMLLGFEPAFEDEEINSIVENGLRTESTTHDFFSQKGDSYFKAINVEKLQDEDFIFN